MTFCVPNNLEQYRVQLPVYPIGDEQNGALVIKPRGLHVIFSSGAGWEHVSVSRQSRVPTYDDMDEMKREFWGDDQTVMQLHVPREDHINHHDYCLHLWRPIDQEIPQPPSLMVGFRN